LCAVEDVVEEHFLETDGISGVVCGNCNRLTLVIHHGLCGHLLDTLRTHQLCAEDHLLAYFRCQFFTCFCKNVAEDRCLLRGHIWRQLDLLDSHVTSTKFKRITPHRVLPNIPWVVLQKSWSFSKIHFN
jgi:hypothetical protein